MVFPLKTLKVTTNVNNEEKVTIITNIVEFHIGRLFVSFLRLDTLNDVSLNTINALVLSRASITSIEYRFDDKESGFKPIILPKLDKFSRT